MRIRDAAKHAGLTPAAIRHYDQLGLLGRVVRTSGGYRDFSERDVRLLIFLRKARELGFSLQECAELLELVAAPDRHSDSKLARTRGLAAARLADIDAQIERLQRMRELVDLHLESIGVVDADCPVTTNLVLTAVNRDAGQ